MTLYILPYVVVTAVVVRKTRLLHSYRFPLDERYNSYFSTAHVNNVSRALTFRAVDTRLQQGAILRRQDNYTKNIQHNYKRR
jgi:hypothetical protein